MEQALSSVMRNIVDAQRLDDEDRNKEAYLRYLECILGIASNLLQSIRDAGGSVLITKEIQKQVRLAQQCIERVAVLMDKIGLGQPGTVMIPSEAQIPDEGTPFKSRSFIIVPPLSPEPSANTFSRVRNRTPMEIAYQRNQQLMAAYRERMTRMNKRDPGAASLSLTLQRKMAENLAIARKQEMALAKKMQERQERLEAEAAKRFTAPIGMSEEEQEQRHIYKKILEYEQDAKWLQEWRTKLESNSQEPELICRLIQDILRCTDHPLTVMLKIYREKIYEKLYPLVANKKQKLSAIIVPLPESLWPPEFCYSDNFVAQKNIATSEINPQFSFETPLFDDLSMSLENERRDEDADQSASDNVTKVKDMTAASNDSTGIEHISSKSSLGSAADLDRETRTTFDKDEMKKEVDFDISENSQGIDGENKKELSDSMAQNKKLSQQLAYEQERMAKMLHQVSQDYEKYNEENMDDLFDDGEENEYEDHEKQMLAHLPESDQNTVSVSQTTIGPNSMVFRSLSGMVQEFPSLPSVVDDSSEIETLSSQAYERHLKNISADVHMYMEKMLVLFTIAYEQLDSPLGRDQCYASLEEMFFKPLWKFLLMLFRGADDLLPVMSYVVVKSQLPQLVSECRALSEFIHEGYLMGQEGYCLTTVETAVSYIVTSDLPRLCSPN
ncbi:hypothetical protein C0Q70_18719 [Pomacea canaliculata]|uniref:VPS9 domain-containing protein n=1 Tax=Pomacea canaliculata TaxID=400727 RepID=A0A2T7NHA9_POMCA|nr:hypothetical protein C0Q70_18719 [Pomacea canaliculata]